MVNPPIKRDELLDFYKGIAIILVVLGHTFQLYNRLNFDESLGFRIIYSFHMPLFVFLSGAATANWLGTININSNLYTYNKGALLRIYKSAVRLLLPFVAWGGSAFLYERHSRRCGCLHYFYFFEPRYFFMVFDLHFLLHCSMLPASNIIY